MKLPIILSNPPIILKNMAIILRHVTKNEHKLYFVKCRDDWDEAEGQYIHNKKVLKEFFIACFIQA